MSLILIKHINSFHFSDCSKNPPSFGGFSFFIIFASNLISNNMDANDVQRALLKKIQGTRASVDELTDYILNNMPVRQIAESLAIMVYESETVKPITISQEEFEKHFRIRGITANNEIERRGRPRKEDKKVTLNED